MLGQSWGGFLAQEHALTQPSGLRSLVLSNTAASFPDFVAEANALRAELPPGSRRRCAGTRTPARPTTRSTPRPAWSSTSGTSAGCCPWPQGVVDGLAKIDEDPTVYHTMNGPSEFHVIGIIRTGRPPTGSTRSHVPTYVISGEHDEATPALQVPLVEGIRAAGNEVEQTVMAGLLAPADVGAARHATWATSAAGSRATTRTADRVVT